MKKLLVMLITIMFMVGCQKNAESEQKPIASQPPQNQTETNQPPSEEPIPPSVEPIFTETPESVEILMNSMTLEEKIAQLFIVDLFTYTGRDAVTEVDNQLRILLSEQPVGGVIFFSNNITDVEQVTSMISDLQSSSKVPLWISVDEEGGIVARLQRNPNIGMTKIPSASVIGGTMDPTNAYNVGYVIGRELNALGFNMDFAPVADVNTNPNNPIIGDRAFSSDPDIVALMVLGVSSGLLEQNVVPVIKHFPGHGDTSTDTHTGAVYVEHDKERLNSIELVPFQHAINADFPCIMAAHISLPNITGNDIPASLNSQILTDLLREEMGFSGIIITDALNMGAVSPNYEADEACIEAILAGVDILLMPQDYKKAYYGVLNAVLEGRISQERIDESVRRILELKMKMNFFEPEKLPLDVIGSQEHYDLIEAISE